MRLTSIAFAAGFLITASIPGHAASVSSQSGSVFVNTGKGFVAVTNSATVGPGAQVLVRNGGYALISYDNACRVRVGSGRVWKIAHKAPCAEGSTFVDMAALTGRQGAEGDAVPPPADAVVPPPPPEPGFSPLVVGGVVVAAGVGIALAVSGGDDGDPPPASP